MTDRVKASEVEVLQRVIRERDAEIKRLELLVATYEEDIGGWKSWVNERDAEIKRLRGVMRTASELPSDEGWNLIYDELTSGGNKPFTNAD